MAEYLAGVCKVARVTPVAETCAGVEAVRRRQFMFLLTIAMAT
jgi:hypothetical protein